MFDEGYFSISFALWGFLTLFTFIQIRKFIKGGQFSEDTSAEGKIAVVTGANSGIGRQIAKELNLRGAKVYMLCRNKDKGIKAINELAQEGCDITRLLLKLVDLSDFSTIQKFAYEIQRHVDKIDILVNCAAIMCHPGETAITQNNHELTWQVNYLGHFVLTELLLPLLKKSWNGRVINVSCGSHNYAEKAEEPTEVPNNFSAKFDLYCQTKLAVIMHARELARRIRDMDTSSTVVVNACHPGICYTGLYRHTPLKFLPIKILLLPFLSFLLKSDKDGAQTPVYMALSKHLENVSGKYFMDCKEAEPSKEAMDDVACELLYRHTLCSVGLSDVELPNGKSSYF